MLSRCEIFGGVRCAKVAEHVAVTGRACWIFSICSDDRLPDALDQRLLEVNARDIPTHLVILGDFTEIPPKMSPASCEAIRLLAKAANYRGSIQTCWLNGETIDHWYEHPSKIHWYDIPYITQQNEVATWPDVNPEDVIEREVCNRICALIGVNPGVGLSSDGRVISLNLTSPDIYRRSLIADMRTCSKERLWSLILQLRGLRELRMGFSKIEYIPDLSELRELEVLDLRGNPAVDLSQLHTATSLRKLNVAACELKAVPEGVSSLNRLQTLLLHKNFIEEVSSISVPASLERFSLYRNRIAGGTLFLKSCNSLSEVNLGANPIAKIFIIVSDTINKFDLRIRHVRGDIRIFWRTRLGRAPARIRYD